MSGQDRQHWDQRYEASGLAEIGEVGPPALFADFEHLFPTAGTAFEVACGRGRSAAWLAARGLQVWGIDVSPVAIELAREYAQLCGVGDRCRFDVHDLDGGLPPGDPVDLVLCHLFRDADIDDAMIDRLKPGGVLAVACLSEVGHGPGRFRAAAGALTDAFGHLEELAAGEADGHAWFAGRTR